MGNTGIEDIRCMYTVKCRVLDHFERDAAYGGVGVGGYRYMFKHLG